jgi:hypothetical protein
MPHGGDWEKGRVWQASERFNLRFHAVQVEPTRHGKNPRALSFLELKQEGLHVSAVKRSEDGQGWVVRLFNPSPEGKKNALRLNRGFSSPAGTQSPVERVQAEFELPSKGGGPWSKVRLVSLEEKPEKDLDLDQEGWVAFEIGFKKILTLEFIP